jgi:hypothetical protein
MKMFQNKAKEALTKHRNTISLVESFMYALFLLMLTSGLKIINPKNTSWLSFGDGTSEIAWEFFRQQPILQFPLGLNPRYGLEISSTIAFDGQIPLMSLLLHPIGPILPERFQYFGLFIFLTFALNFAFAKRIFNILKFDHFQSSVSAILLASSPVILNRFIENTHYSLTSSWILFAAISLSITKNSSSIKWGLLYISAILIHLYFLPFVIIIHVLTLISLTFNSRNLVIKNYLSFLAILFVTVITLFIVGYFFGGISGKDVGYGLFRSTLFSLVDSSGWSVMIPDIAEPDGAYEGFSYLGLPTILVIILNIILGRQRTFDSQNLAFMPVWVSSIILFVFSLSNKISAGKFELFSFNVPTSLSLITSTFRSSGRFTWLLVFTLFIFTIFKLKNKMSQKRFSIILIAILGITLADYFPQLQSHKNTKFTTTTVSNLTDPSWQSISECYRNIRVYPPTVAVENGYEFVTLAYEQNLGINTGRFSRLNQVAILEAYDEMHREFNTGYYREDSFYIFSNAEYILPDLVDFQKNLAIQTLNENSSYGDLNGYTFIAPNLKNCQRGESLKSSSLRFGPPSTKIYKGEQLRFGLNQNSEKYILIGFSALEDWGVWSVDEYSKITFNTRDIDSFTRINIQARDLTSPPNSFSVFVNSQSIGTCSFSTEFSLCSLNYDFSNLKTNIVSIEFKPSIIRSPKSLGNSDDTRNLGFGLTGIYLS